MTVPNVVVFDLGKVLLDFDYAIAVRKLLPRCTVNARQVQTLIDQSPLLFEIETGRITIGQFFHQIQAATGFRGEADEFYAAFSDVFSPIPPMIELHAQLHARNIPTYIFSNTNELATRHIRKNFPFFTQFDGYILSHEHGAMKPDAKLYEVVERDSGRRGADILYLDDREENVVAGRQRGWQSIHHLAPEPTIVAIRAAGLLG
ncbi:MAG: HAD family phosphatase [Verrucomicrobia bacterium]|nr:HAD family phosphatase [Verrucomicrobiota bacterium]